MVSTVQEGFRKFYLTLKQASAWEDKLVFATFYLGGEFDEEKESFYIVNTTAKSINTGSKLELRLGIDDVREEEKNAVLLTRKIADESKIWKNLIKYLTQRLDFFQIAHL